MKAEMQIYSLEYMREFASVVNYDKKTGAFTWGKKTSKNISIGMKAGYKTQKGYIRISYKGKSIFAHRLAWFIAYGSINDQEIDHIKGTRDDNRISNLRVISHADNVRQLNKSKRQSKTGVLGVSINQGKFVAQLQVNGKHVHLGRFTNLEEASKAYQQAKSKLHPNWIKTA